MKQVFGKQRDLSGPAWGMLRILYGLGALFCLFYSLVPILGYGVTHIGIFVLLTGGIVLAAAALCLPRLARMRHFFGLHAAFLALVIAAFGLYAGFALSYRIYLRTCPPPSAGEEQTVIVLGGKIEDGRPRLMLARRLHMAAGYLGENPAARCIVTGGQGADEDQPEAHVMRDYLLELGIRPERIEIEDASRDTRENITFSAAIIREKGLSESVTIVSDGFHQLRAAYFCRQNGLSFHALATLTPWGLIPSYEVREMGAWVKALLGF